MERTLITPDAPLVRLDLDSLLGGEGDEAAPSPFAGPGEEPPAATADAFDAQILAALVSP